MLIQSLKMENFRQFKGTNNITFSCDPEQNVTIILGDNTFGKTTLLQAFNWCFYGKALFDQNPDFLLNLEVAGEMNVGDQETVEVEVTVSHQSVEYVITRTQRYRCTEKSVKGEIVPTVKVSYKQADGQTESVKEKEIKNVINEILPEDLSTYFFFDTERVNSISTRKDVADAVKGLLGLTTIENAIKHLGEKEKKKTVIGGIYANMNLEGDSRAQEALDRIQTGEEKCEEIEEQLEECTSQINQYEARREQLNDILRDNQSTATLQKRKENLDRWIDSENKAMNEAMDQYFREFSEGSLAFFIQPLLKTTSDFLKEVKVDDKGIRDLTKPTIMELIQRGRCICGREISEGNDAYQHLMDELAYVPPESIGNTVRHYREKLESFSKPAERTYESMTQRYQEIFREKTRIQEWEEEQDEISEQIKDKDNMERYESELSDIKDRLRDLNEKKERLIREDGAQKHDIASARKAYDTLIVTSGKNEEAMVFIEYAEKIRDWLSDTYKEKEKTIRNELEKRVNDIFEKMYHGHRRVSIDSKYQVTLLTTVADKEIEAGESEGLNRVKNFAFIAGLVSLAKEKIISDDSEDDFSLSSEPYPLVMDAPFSNADETHTANISKVLPEVAEQVIMFVMKKDWNYAEPVMGDHVGKSYTLDKVSETYTKIR